MRNLLSILLMTLCLFRCTHQKESNVLKNGFYRASLTVQDGQELPFIFKVRDSSHLEIYNADEVIYVENIKYRKDSVYIQTPVFEGFIAAKVEANGNLTGQFIKKSLDRVVPFSAEYGNSKRFEATDSKANITGVWEVVFSKGIVDDQYLAKGVFEQKGNRVTGTFRTTTGDYRYLEGVVDGNTMKLSTFDGAHAFVFIAEVSDSTMNGQFYSGNHWKEPFVGKLNSSYELPDENSLTFLKEGYDTVDFEFPDASDHLVSLSDDRFKNKVVVVQIMGTWCPNCLDESKYYTQFYKAHKDEDFEIVALAFEYAKTKEKAFEGIKRLTQKLDIEYPVLLAQYGSSDKGKANEKLPMLNHVLSYPTSIFIDKKGVVRKIHTGFNGPATGQKYLDFKLEFETFINELLSE